MGAFMAGDTDSNYFDLGQWHRPVTTTSDGAQRWFDRGLNWLFGFNHDEAVICFQRALEEDPACVMAYWGVAYSIGPNYNKIWEMFEPAERESVLQTAHHAIETGMAESTGTDVEKAMLAA